MIHQKQQQQRKLNIKTQITKNSPFLIKILTTSVCVCTHWLPAAFEHNRFYKCAQTNNIGHHIYLYMDGKHEDDDDDDEEALYAFSKTKKSLALAKKKKKK